MSGGAAIHHPEIVRRKEDAMLVANPLSPRSWGRQVVDSVSKGWWALLLSGLISIVAGGLILLIRWSVSDLAIFLGALFLFRGVVTMFSRPLDGSAAGWAIALGLLEVAVGVAVWVWPEPTLLVIAAFIGWWVLFSGIMTIAGSISARRFLPYWGLFLALGIAELVLSVWLLSRPGLTLVAAVLAIGLWSLIYGVVLVVVAVDLKNLPGRLDEADPRLRVRAPEDSAPRVSRAG
jgi:uncharacterized membrane protein HdeD (DUF308 family)